MSNYWDKHLNKERKLILPPEVLHQVNYAIKIAEMQVDPSLPINTRLDIYARICSEAYSQLRNKF